MSAIQKFSTSKVINDVVRALLKTGEWEVKFGKRHRRLQNVATQKVITIPGSPSDHRAEKNWLSQIRRDFGVLL